jgi:hypothetical protein
MVGALVLLPIQFNANVMSTMWEMLSYLRMGTHTHVPETLRKPTIKQTRANCDQHVLTCFTRGRCADHGQGGGTTVPNCYCLPCRTSHVKDDVVDQLMFTCSTHVVSISRRH